MDDGRKSPLYSAPEVVKGDPRNRSADIWSLGCVFFEMATILHGCSIQSMQSFFKTENENFCFFANINAAQKWSHELKDKAPGSGGVAFEWALHMMKKDPKARPSAREMYTRISKPNEQEAAVVAQFTSQCCLSFGETVSSKEKDRNIEYNVQAQYSNDRSASPLPTDSTGRVRERGSQSMSDIGPTRRKDTSQDEEPPPAYAELFPHHGMTRDDPERTIVPQNPGEASDSEPFLFGEVRSSRRTSRPSDSEDRFNMKQATDPFPQIKELFNETEFPQPNLSWESWDSPMDLLEDILSDDIFVGNLTTKDPDFYELIKECNISDLTRLVDSFIRSGFDPAKLARTAQEGDTAPAAVASWGPDFDALFELLINQQAETRGLESNFPLAAACAAGNLFAIDLLLDRGMDIDKPMRNDITVPDEVPLSWAVKENNSGLYSFSWREWRTQTAKMEIR